MNNIQNLTENLLEDARLYVKVPFTNKSGSLNTLASCNDFYAIKELTRLNKIFPIQKTVWPYILNGDSSILIGNTQCYPQLLYLPIVCGLIKVISQWIQMDFLWTLGQLSYTIFFNFSLSENEK